MATPAVNLDTIPGLIKIQCQQNGLILTIKDMESARIIETWPPKVILFVSHGWPRCFKDETPFHEVFLVGLGRDPLSKTIDISLQTKPIAVSETTHSFHISIGFNPGPKKFPRPNKHVDATGLHTHNFNFFYDQKKPNTSTHPNFNIFSFSQPISIACRNCFAYGSVECMLY